MSDDAQAWVWQHSRAKGCARLVLLALAYAVTDDSATARMGTAAMMQRANAGKGAVVTAIETAAALGELEIIEPGAGKRATLYRLPGVLASGPVSGPLQTRSGPVSGPLATPDGSLRSGERTASASRSGERTASPIPSGPVSGPLQLDLTDHDDHATRAQASFKAFTSMSEGVREGWPAPERRTAIVPEFARPLVDRITASGVVVKWSLGEGEWFTLDHLLQRSGADMLAAEAVRVAGRTNVSHARYFLRAWRDLPPTPAAGTAPVPPAANVVPLAPARLGRADQAAAWYAQFAQEMTQ